MCGFQDVLSNVMPIDWLDPYGRTPFAKDAELSVDITIVETEDGIRARSVKNPPTTGGDRLMDAIKNALGVGMIDCMDPCETEENKTISQEQNSGKDNQQKKSNQIDDKSFEHKDPDRLSQNPLEDEKQKSA